VTRYVMVIDLKRCIGCGACTAACLTENLNSTIYFEKPPLEHLVKQAAEADTREEREKILKEYLWTRTSVVRLYSRNGIFFLHIMCHHCDNAPCVTVCPTGASFQRKDGVVLVDPDKCILCGYCIVACPYAARRVNPLSRTIDKCTFCVHRIDEGRPPACVETCPTHARIFGDLDDPKSEVFRLVKSGEAIAGTSGSKLSVTRPRVYIIPPSAPRREGG